MSSRDMFGFPTLSSHPLAVTDLTRRAQFAQFLFLAAVIGMAFPI